MPLYEYRCENCGDVFEVMKKFSDPTLTVHDKCGGKVTRLFSAPAFHLKGSGWYATDYAKGGSSSPASKQGGGDNGKSENSKSKTSDSGSASSSSSSDSSSSKPAASSDKK